MTDVVGTAETDLAAILCNHPAVAWARVTTSPSTAWIVPDARAAPMLFGSAVLEEDERLGSLAWHEPADDLRVAGFNRRETDFLYREIFVDGTYFRRGVRLPRDPVVVDVGANIGMFTIRTALEYPDARIVAVEPVAELAEAVRINAELYEAPVTVVCAALGGADAEADFTFYRHNSVMSGRFADTTEDAGVLKGYLLTGGGSADDAQLDRMVAGRMVGERRRVPVTTVTQVASAQGLHRIDLLKIDVEKAELDVLAGIDDSLWPVIGRIVLEAHDIDGRLDAIVDLLRGRGYTVEVEQDPRLVMTPCHTVYARRGEVAAEGPTSAVRGERGPTLRRLERDLRRLLAERCPAAAVPQHFAIVTDPVKVRARPARARPREATRRTAVLAGAWSDLFGDEAVRPDADFFDLGGTSLNALRLLDRVEAELGPDVLTAGLIFELSTFGALADAIEAADER
jgi:FkbM family methyltransferase